MHGHGGQTVVQFLDACDGASTHLVQKPKHAMAFDQFVGRQLAECAVTAQQNPGPGLRKCKGETIRKGKRRYLPPVGKGTTDPIAIQLLNR